MPPDEFVVPALPVLLPLAGVLMIGCGAVLRRRGPLTARRLVAAGLCVAYAVAVVGATMLPLRATPDGPVEWFRINPVPLYQLHPRDFVLNVLMTVPVAAVVAVLSGVRGRGPAVRAGLVLSVAIEVTQCALILTVHGNRWAEANDVLANVLGAYLGAVLLERLTGPRVRRGAAGYRPEPSRE